MNIQKEITDFLNVEINRLLELPPEIFKKMETAVKNDDYPALHLLGHELEMGRGK